MEQSENASQVRDLGRLFRRSFFLPDAQRTHLAESLPTILGKCKFRKLATRNEARETTLRATYGSRLLALLVGLIPFGVLVPWGKRLRASITLRERDQGVDVNIAVIPYMELFDSEEMAPVTQGGGEKITDEMFAAKKLREVVLQVYEACGATPPEDLLNYSAKSALLDSLLNLLVFPLDGLSRSRALHIPQQPGPRWNWGAFMLPEAWFLWNEIWGASILVIGLEYLALRYLGWNAFGLACVFLLHATSGLMGSRIHFARHGRWPR